MFYSKTKRQLARIQEVVNSHSRGIYKRIDENRELMELLAQDHGPGLLERNSCVASWLESQDDFFDALRVAGGLPVNKPGGPLVGYPRPRPSYKPCHDKDDEAIPQISADEIRQCFGENRILIDALPRLTPDGFMRENRWIDGLLHLQGEFITKVAAVFGVTLPQHQPDSHNSCLAIRQQVPDGFHMLTKGFSKLHDEVVSGTNTYRDELNDNADTVEVAKEKYKQLNAIESACRQSEVAISGPRFNFAAFCGSAAFLALNVLLWPTRLPGWSVVLCSLTACISVFFLTYQFSTRPLEWGELICNRLAGYDPIDKEAYRCLQKDIGAKGYMDQSRVREWARAERCSIRRAFNTDLLSRSEFLRKVI